MQKKSKSNEESVPYLVFRYCKDKCFACAGCGYIWGPAHPNAGEKPYWVK